MITEYYTPTQGRRLGINYRFSLATAPALPNKEYPLMTRCISQRTLDEAPKDIYRVKALSPATDIDSIHNVSKDKEELVSDTIVLVKVLIQNLELIRNVILSMKRYDNIVNSQKPSRLFHAPLNEDKLSECIINVMDIFFHGEKNCTICDRNYSHAEFFVLVHIFFSHIAILKKDSNLSFSNFLKENVYAGKPAFSDRTFRTYAQKDIFKKLKQDVKKIKLSFNRRPTQPETPDGKFLIRAFQEIGWAFQNSEYFKEIRLLKEQLQIFVI